MDTFESNCIVLRTILGSCLSGIIKLMPLWHYGILSLEEEGNYSISFLLNLTMVELKQILESCGFITIKDNRIKLVIDTSGRGGNYSWSMFLLENSLSSIYCTIIYVSRYNIYQIDMYFIGLCNDRDTKNNPSSQFY